MFFKKSYTQEYKNKKKDFLEVLEGQRVFKKYSFANLLIIVVAFLWSTFQLYVTYFPINSTLIRSIHLAFGVFLAFLIYPALKKNTSNGKVGVLNYIIATIASIGCLYIFLNYNALSLRAGAYTTMDITVAIVTTLLLLEATRRVIGSVLPIVILLFLAYDYFGPYMPSILAHKGASINKLAGHMFLTTEGIFGVPLGVSAGFIFLFVLFGALLDKAGAGKYFINLSNAFLGKYKGGSAKAAVLGSALTGVVSGSSTANVVTTGTFTIPLMKKAKIPPYKAAAIEVASSVNGQLMPPIMGAAAFIMAEFLGISYIKIIFASFLPAILCYFTLFYIVHIESLKMNLKGEDKSKIPSKFKTFISGIHFLIPVFYLLYVLMILRQSAQSAAFSSILLTMILIVLQKPIKAIIKREKITLHVLFGGFAEIFQGMVGGAKNMIPIALATAVAGVVVGSITLTGIGQVLIELVETFSGNSIVLILIFTALISIVLGLGLPTTANYIIVSSLAAPIVMELASLNNFIVPIIAIHLFVFYFGILADDTPPVGIAAYAGSAIAKSNPIKTGMQSFIYDMRTAILPFMFFFNNKLILIDSVDQTAPNDSSKWVWITNPFEILIIFATAFIGMMAFASFTQNYFLRKTNILEKLMLLVVTPLMLIPNIIVKYTPISNIYMPYTIGIAIFILVFLSQKYKKAP